MTRGEEWGVVIAGWLNFVLRVIITFLVVVALAQCMGVKI